MRTKLIIAIISVYLIGQFIYGAELAYLTAHPRATTIEEAGVPDPTVLGYPPAEEVTLTTRDNIRLEGWHFRGTGDAAVIIAHNRGQNRAVMLSRAHLLMEEGYGVLLFDFRSHGNSEKTLSSMGWLEAEDIHAAVAYMREEQGYTELGLFGVSYGSHAILYAAQQDETLTPLILESISPIQLSDELPPCTLKDVPFLPSILTFYTLDSLFHGGPAPTSMAEALRDVAPRPALLIHGAANAHEICQHENLITQGDHIEGWLIDGYGHVPVGGIDANTYRERIIGFLIRNGVNP